MCHFDQIRNYGNGRREISADHYGRGGYDPILDSRRLNTQHERIRDRRLRQ